MTKNERSPVFTTTIDVLSHLPLAALACLRPLFYFCCVLLWVLPHRRSSKNEIECSQSTVKRSPKFSTNCDSVLQKTAGKKKTLIVAFLTRRLPSNAICKFFNLEILQKNNFPSIVRHKILHFPYTFSRVRR